MLNLYSYDRKEPLDFILIEDRNLMKYFPWAKLKKSIKKYVLTFRSPYCTGFEKNDEVYIEFFLNDYQDYKDNESIVIIIHGFATKLSKVPNYYNFIAGLLNNNINCAFFNLPYHLQRTLVNENTRERLSSFNDTDKLNFFHQAVVDIRMLIDIAQQEFNFKRIILCGFSLGSMVATIATAMDNRISKTILLMEGGNWHEIHWNGILAYMLKGNCLGNSRSTKNNCFQCYKDFHVFLKEFKNTNVNSRDFDLSLLPDSKEKIINACFLCDPLAFANKIIPEKILMINSKLDHYFSKNSSIQLWRELTEPKIYWFFKLHASKVLLNPKIFNIILNFVRN